MEVFFLDVGQGTCQVVLIGNRTAIVIDSSTRNSRLPLHFLSRMGIEQLAALITTHSHSDHLGGATAILGHFGESIDRIGFVQDDMFLGTAYWKRISQWLADGVLHREQLARLECNPTPQVIWRDRSLHAALRVFSPLPAQNLMAQQGKNPNATSAVLILDVGTQRVVFAADSELVQWQDIHRQHGCIPCGIMSVPHHGGRIHRSPADLVWLYQDAVRPGVGVVSVGTTNTHGHPREDVIKAIRATGGSVLCTQMTAQCSHDLEAVRKKHLTQRYTGASSITRQTTKAGRSRNIPCAGSIRVEVVADNMTIEPFTEHQRLVSTLPTRPACPLCRR